MTRQKPLEGYRQELLALRDKYAQLRGLLGPCDRAAAEKAVSDLYVGAGMNAPVFLWYASPHEAAKAGILLDLLQATLSTTPEDGVVTSHGIARQIHEYQPGQTMRRMQKWINTGDLPWSMLTQIRNVIDTEPLRNRHDQQIVEHVSRLLARDNPPDVRPEDRFTWLRTCKEMFEQLGTNVGSALAHLTEFAEAFFSLSESEQHWLIRVSRSQTRNDPRALFGFPASILSKFEFGNGDAHFAFDMEVKALVGMARTEAFEAYMQTIQLCGWWQPHEEFCIMVDRPVELHLDNNGGLHRVNGPAVRYSDGHEIFAFRNLEVTPEMARGDFTAEDIDSQRNIELRRVMIDVYGAARYLRESGSEEIQRDECGVLYAKDMPNDEKLVMVKVVNSTPEPDGTFKEYFLRVPPTITTARAAVAWTFGFREVDYQPAKET